MTTISELTVEIEGKEVGLSALLQKVDAQTQKAADSALKLQQQYARLAQAQGNTAGASSILSSALLNNGGASEQALVGVGTQLTRLQTGFQGAGSYAEQFGGALKQSVLGIVGPAAIATTAISALKGEFDLTIAGGQLKATETSFGSLAATAGQSSQALLSAMRAAAQGTISDAELMKSANTGLLLSNGRIAKELPRLIEIARASAQATGQDIGFVFDSLVRGISRGSPQIIDNAGITLDAAGAFEAYAKSIGKSADELTKAEQQQATLNAVVAAGGDIIQKTGSGIDASAGAFTRLGTALTNVKDTFSVGLAGTFAPVADGLTGILTGLNGTQQGFANFAAGVTTAAQSLQGFGPATQAQAQANQQQADSVVRGAQALGEYLGILGPATAATQASAQATLVASDASDRQAQASTNVAGALADELDKKIAGQQATANLAQLQAQLEADSRLAAQGLLGSGDQALALANKYGIAASAAQFLIQQQQALANKAALADQRAGERNPGSSGLAEQAAEDDRRLKALYRTLADPPKPPKRTGGGGGGGATAYRQQLQDQAKYQGQSEDAEAQHLAKREQIYAQYAERVRKAQDDLQQSQLDTAASFYDSLGGISSGKIQQQASAEYEQTVQEAAAMGGEAGQKYLEAKEAVILARAKRQESIQKAQDGGDSAAAEYQRGVDAKYRAAEDAKLERIKAGGDAAANERDKALADEDSRYADSQEKIATGAERSAERRALAHAKAGQAVDAEQAKLNTLAATYDRLGPRAPAAAAATTTTPAPAVSAEAGAPPDPVAAAVDGAREAIVAALAAIERATRETTGAVRGLKATGGVAG